MAIRDFPIGVSGGQWLANKRASEMMMLEQAFVELLDDAQALRAENEQLKTQLARLVPSNVVQIDQP